jgi:hypothetical protein
MNVMDVLRYGHRTLMDSVEGLGEEDWLVGEVCGVWSVKDIFAHLASYEEWHAEVLGSFLEDVHTPVSDAYRKMGGEFNDAQVEMRRSWAVERIVTAYQQSHATVLGHAAGIPGETYRENGTLPWYGEGYCLNDFLVYSSYGHKREHSAQVHVYRDSLLSE